MKPARWVRVEDGYAYRVAGRSLVYIYRADPGWEVNVLNKQCGERLATKKDAQDFAEKKLSEALAEVALALIGVL